MTRKSRSSPAASKESSGGWFTACSLAAPGWFTAPPFQAQPTHRPYLPLASFSNRGLSRSGSKFGSIRSQPGVRT